MGIESAEGHGEFPPKEVQEDLAKQHDEDPSRWQRAKTAFLKGLDDLGQLEMGNYPTVTPLETLSKDIGGTAIRFAADSKDKTQPEIFDTIQGEGRHLGRPTVFARLSGCNLQCSWCDTPYTWAFTERLAEKHDEGLAYSKDTEQVVLQVGEAIDQLSGYSLDRLVITGGEPMLQQQAIQELSLGMKDEREGYWVEVETNGTIVPTQETIDAVDQFNVSPKMENSGNDLKKRHKEKALKAYARLDKADFKFVVMDDSDLPEILDMVEKYEIPPERVFLMPEGRTEEEVTRHQIQLVELAKEHNFNVTTRLHVLIWGAERGV